MLTEFITQLLQGSDESKSQAIQIIFEQGNEYDLQLLHIKYKKLTNFDLQRLNRIIQNRYNALSNQKVDMFLDGKGSEFIELCKEKSKFKI